MKKFYDVVRHVRLRHAQNEQWDHSNQGYSLLSILVGPVTEQTLREFARPFRFAIAAFIIAMLIWP